MIEKLTQQQIKMAPIVRNKWLEIGLSTVTNKETTELAVSAVYAQANLPPPQLIIWLNSPLQGVYGAHLLSQLHKQINNQVGDQIRDQIREQVGEQVGNQVGNQVRDQVWEQVWDQVWEQVGGQVWDQVEEQVRKQVKEQVEDQVREQVWNQVWNQVWDQVWGQVGGQVWDQVRSSKPGDIRTQLHTCGYGLHDAPWLGFYDFFLHQCNIAKCADLKPLMLLAEHGGWWWPYTNATILTPKPSYICRDEQGRLHHENKKALEYPDGWGLYCWHGVRVPANIILHPDQITKDEILKETNQELKRIKLERYGLPRWLKEIDATCLNTDERGQLLETKYMASWEGEDQEGARYVLVKDSSTSREYALRVPPNTKTPSEGIARTFGLPNKEMYQPIKET